MQKIVIKKDTNETGATKYIVTAISLKQSNGKSKRIPHPMGTDIIEFSTIAEAIEAIKLSGFNYILPDGTSPFAKDVKTHVKIKDHKWEDTICQALLTEAKNPNSNIKAAAIFSLGELKEVDLLPIYIDNIGEDNENIRNNAIDSIVKLGSISANAVIEALNDGNWVRRNSAITCIEKLVTTLQKEPEAFFISLIEKFSDQNAIVKTSAITTLGKIYKIYCENSEKK